MAFFKEKTRKSGKVGGRLRDHRGFKGLLSTSNSLKPIAYINHRGDRGVVFLFCVWNYVRKLSYEEMERQKNRIKNVTM
jgi:hypothetical protein